jgi:prepilin-type N-terminal cleavage/methylation domain-containing protein
MTMKTPGTSGRRVEQRGVSLVELLVAMTILSIVTTMILVGWFSLSDSYSFTVRSNVARDDARQAISRMAREIRDAQYPENILTTSECAIVRARARWIELYTTFNDANAASPLQNPRLVMYRLYADGDLWRYEDVNESGSISGVSLPGTEDPWWQSTFNASEQLNGEGATLMVAHVVNNDQPQGSDPATPVFSYSHYLSDGSVEVLPAVYGTAARSTILSVQIQLQVDLNPGHSPVFVDLKTTAQLRNQH